MAVKKREIIETIFETWILKDDYIALKQRKTPSSKSWGCVFLFLW